ncbi:carbohydrate kinase family protein [Paraglaciecola sp.]|uniref:carbohydrate kinase family protein n=1 Tax=Paraglaciecola sp. TaxID=1920173 RepID=UPI003EF8E564
MSQAVICFGEAIIDFLNTATSKEGKLSLNQFTQFPGGAPANAAVAVAKLGGNAKFVGQLGDDPFGHFIIDALESYGVDTSYTYIHPTAKTALAFVFLDEQGERTFSFHREATADLVFEKSQIDPLCLAQPSIFHFCSNTLTHSAIAEVTNEFVDIAVQQQSTISFDVNLRHNLWQSGEADKERVTALVHKSHIVKFSKEEIDYLCDGQISVYIKACFSHQVKVILITDGANPVQIITANSRLCIQPPGIKAVDTTGGGDAFIGAVLFGLSKSAGQALDNIENLKGLVEFASQCGALAVSRQGAFPAFPQFSEVERFYEF